MAIPSHVFISDVHLGAFNGETKQSVESDLIALVHFCITHGVQLYILGDLFDYWMEFPDQQYIPQIGVDVLEAFEEYNRKVQPALYITGNHDNWTFGHFEERGFDVEPNFRILTIDCKKVFLMHGDGKYRGGTQLQYSGLHALLRSQWFISAYQKLFKPELALRIMKLFSHSTSKVDRRDLFPLNNQAELILETMDVDWVIMGHDHLPRHETFALGSYINTGTFFEHRTVAVHNNSGFELVKWRASDKDFVPLKESITAV